jgi:RHS repeat-associated protein
MRKDGVVTYMHGDHLGSTSLTTNQAGAVIARVLYYPYGEVRYTEGTLQTDYGYTGQRRDSYTQLLEMGVRWYDPQIGRWISADTIVPDLTNSQSLNRYSYVLNRPLVYVDPSGHIPWWVIAAGAVALVGGGVSLGVAYDIVTTPAINDPALRASPPPTSGDVTPWLVDQMVTNAQAEATGRMQEAWQGGPIKKAAALKAWVSLVRTGAIWDFKKDLRDAGLPADQTVLLAGRRVNYQAVANIHFGFVGGAVGFEEWQLFLGAGLFHAGDNPPDKWGTLETYLDDPFDNWWIAFGFYLYEQYEDRVDELTKDVLEEELEKYIGDHGEPPEAPL